MGAIATTLAEFYYLYTPRVVARASGRREGGCMNTARALLCNCTSGGRGEVDNKTNDDDLSSMPLLLADAEDSSTNSISSHCPSVFRRCSQCYKGNHCLHSRCDDSGDEWRFVGACNSPAGEWVCSEKCWRTAVDKYSIQNAKEYHEGSDSSDVAVHSGNRIRSYSGAGQRQCA